MNIAMTNMIAAAPIMTIPFLLLFIIFIAFILSWPSILIFGVQVIDIMGLRGIVAFH